LRSLILWVCHESQQYLLQNANLGKHILFYPETLHPQNREERDLRGKARSAVEDHITARYQSGTEENSDATHPSIATSDVFNNATVEAPEAPSRAEPGESGPPRAKQEEHSA